MINSNKNIMILIQNNVINLTTRELYRYYLLEHRAITNVLLKAHVLVTYEYNNFGNY